jgi:hypothetical protein
VIEFRRLGLLSEGISFSVLPPGRATNVGTVGAFAYDVSTLSTMDGVVWTLDSVTDALSIRMVRTSLGI